MPPILFKDLLVEIRHTLGRYLSILFIVALGVAFFAGIKASAPDMTNSADAYMDKYNLQDIQVYSTIGINQSDLDALKEVHGVEDVQGQYTSDFLAKKDAKELVVKLITYQDDQKINKPRLVDGRMPENDGECLIQGPSATGKIMGSTFEVGDTIELYSGNSTPVDDSLKTTTFKVVGSAYSPNYLSYELGSSAIGSGQVNTFIYVPQDVLANDIYTEADVIVQGAKDLDTYSDAYFDLTTPVLERIESIADEQVAKDIQSFNDELDAKEQEVNDKLLDGQHELDEAKKKLDDARAQYDDGLRQYNEGVQTLADSKTQYENGLKEYEDGKKQLEDGLNQLNDGIAQIKAGEAQLEDLQDQRTQLTAALAVLPTLNTTSDTISKLYEQLNSLNERIDSLENLNPNSLLLPSLRESRNNLMNRIIQLLPESAPYFGKDALTDKPARFFVTEIIREKLLLMYDKEIPYSTEVLVEKFDEKEKSIHIMAVIYVERDSQKGIIIGKGGDKIKKVGIEARQDIEKFFDKKVFLELFVKVEKDWRNRENKLRAFGYIE